MNNCENNKLNISVREDGINLSVKVIPNSSKCEVAGVIDGSLKIKLDCPPIEGKANERCIKLLSDILKIPKSDIKILRGETSKNKIIFLKGNSKRIAEVLNDILLPQK
jgi:uncharacterized protein